MGRVNIYIRVENELAWKGIAEKSAWVNERLEKWHPLMGASDTSTGVAPKPKIIKTPKDAKKVIDAKGWSGSIPKSYSARKKK